MDGFGIFEFCSDETCCIRPELSQYPVICFGRGGVCVPVAWMYFSKNRKAESSPYPSDLPECASRWVLGDVLAPIHSSVVGEEIVHKKALRCWAFREALLTISSFPWALLRCLARSCLVVAGAGLKLIHNSDAYFGSSWRICKSKVGS